VPDPAAADKTEPDIAFGHARRAVADCAMCGVVFDPDEHLRRVVEPGRDLNPGGMRLDRVRAVSRSQVVTGQSGSVAATSNDSD
jgi:hypothetical protein